MHPRLSVAEHSSFHAVDAAIGVVEHARRDLLSMHSDSSSSSGGTAVNEMPSLGGSAGSFRKSGSSLEDGALAALAEAHSFSDDESDGPNTSFRDTGAHSTRAVVNQPDSVLTRATRGIDDTGTTQTPSPLASARAAAGDGATSPAPQFVDITPRAASAAAPVASHNPRATEPASPGADGGDAGAVGAGAHAAVSVDGPAAAFSSGAAARGSEAAAVNPANDVASPNDVSVDTADHD